jgi:hypothetical protein
MNHLKPVTSPVTLQRGNIPHPNGLFSTEIFGMTPKDRKQTFAYIDLGHVFFHPHVYKIIKRFFRNVEKIVDGSSFYTINQDGHLVISDEVHGETGVQFLYDNWDKIKWEYTDSSARNERIDIVNYSKKSEVFLSKVVVVPAFYRDVSSGSGGGSVQEINNFYSNLIRLASILRENDSFGWSLYSTQFAIQELLVDVYDYFKDKLEKKNGLLRKYLMGKNVDLCTRTVITGTPFHANKPDDLKINLRYSGVPMHQILALCQPFIMAWLKNFFDRELIENKEKYLVDPKTGKVLEVLEIKNPEAVFTDTYLQKKMDSFIDDPETRFEIIEVPLTNGRNSALVFRGTRMDMASKDELATISTRPMTWTDLFFMACDDVVKDKHCLITRYPIIDQFGVFVTRIRVISTAETIPMQVGEKIYPYYPKVQIGFPEERIATLFIDSTQFSNAYLPGLDGDYDGDQITVKILWTQEANQECEEVMNKKSYFVNTGEKFIRYVEIEVIQTFYNLTKDPTNKNRSLTPVETEKLLNMKGEDFTFEVLTDMFGCVDHPDGKNYPTFYPEDTMTIPKNGYLKNTEPIKTTVGRFVFNKILCEKTGIAPVVGYVNLEITEGWFSGFEKKIARDLLLDKYTTEQMYDYVDTRDWLGMQLHALITPSFTPGTIKIHPEVQKLKDELFKKYEKEIAAGDAAVTEMIEKALIEKTKEVFKDDPGMDLYNSGARGSLGNNYKNIALMRGAVYNRGKGKFEVVKNSLNDGLAIKDIPISSNTILEGAYPKACGTQESGYIAKQLLAECQTEWLDVHGSDCGTKRGIPIEITDENYKRYIDRYIMVNKKPVLLDDDTIKKYIGKRVELRTPMTCIKTAKGGLCNICGGEFYYRTENTNIGLSASKIGNALSRMNMKKFHDNVVHFSEIDVNDMFI